MLDAVPPARLFDEVQKLMLAGHAVASFDWLARLDLLAHLLPDTSAVLAQAPGSSAERLVQLGLANTDARVRADKPVTPTFLFAVLLWPAIARGAGVEGGRLPEDPQRLLTSCDEVLARQLRRIALPKRFSLPMRELIALQSRFERRAGRRALRLLEHPRFRAAYDFLLLRAEAGEADPEVAAFWTRLQSLPPDQRTLEVEAQPAVAGEGDAPRRKRRRRSRRRSRPAE
jgi:poly(A) polymerase